MGTKNKPGNFDCYANAHPDEPMFILLARDPNAPGLVELWATMREQERGPSPKVDEALKCAADMRAWAARPSPVAGSCVTFAGMPSVEMIKAMTPAERNAFVASAPQLVAIVSETTGKDPKSPLAEDDCG